MPRGPLSIINYAENLGEIPKPESWNFLMNAVCVRGPQSGPVFRQQHGSTHSGWNWGASFLGVRILVLFLGPPCCLGFAVALASLMGIFLVTPHKAKWPPMFLKSGDTLS